MRDIEKLLTYIVVAVALVGAFIYGVSMKVWKLSQPYLQRAVTKTEDWIDSKNRKRNRNLTRAKMPELEKELEMKD